MSSVFLDSGYTISPVIRGGWQLSAGHGQDVSGSVLDDLLLAFDAGITTFDCADIYTGVEDLYGQFRTYLLNKRGVEAVSQFRVHTKFVPDRSRLANVDPDYVQSIIDRSLLRLQVDQLDVVQFHWWDYAVDGALAAFQILVDLQRQGKILHLGTTNFDTDHLEQFSGAGIQVLSNQAQYSLLDRRVQKRMTAWCEVSGARLLCYGTVAGGLLSDRYLGATEPQPPFENRSLEKYSFVVQRFGGWELFQELLRVLRIVADRHDVDIATIASAWVLADPMVAGVIVGARNASHVERNACIPSVQLTTADHEVINQVLARSSTLPGEPFDFERDPNADESQIMKYDLNTKS